MCGPDTLTRPPGQEGEETGGQWECHQVHTQPHARETQDDLSQWTRGGTQGYLWWGWGHTSRIPRPASPEALSRAVTVDDGHRRTGSRAEVA